jgi:hypothetical protein
MELREELRQLKDIYLDYEIILRQEELIKNYIQHVLIDHRDAQLSLVIIPLPEEQKQMSQYPAFMQADTFSLESLITAFQNQVPPEPIRNNGQRTRNPEIDRLFIPTKLTAGIIKMLVEHVENSKKELEQEFNKIKEQWTQK